MGWFRRSDDPGDGLYRGDAPVSVPGSGDRGPSAYVRPAPQEPATTTGPAPRESWTGQPAPDQLPAGPVPPGRWTPTGPTPPGPASPGQWLPPEQAGSWAPPPASAARAHTFVVAKRRGPGAGCGLLAIVVILVVLIGVGVAGWAVFRSVRSALPSARDVPATQVGAVDLPVTVDYPDGQLRITVSGAQAQPGSGWDEEAGEPTLIVSTTIERVDDGSGSLHVPFIDWSFTPDGGGPPTDIDLISGFEPDLTSVTLGAGDTVSGYLAFTTGTTGGRLALAGDYYQDPPLVTWQLSAATAQPVPGTVGAAVQPQVGRPPFTVTLDSTTWTDQAGVAAWKPPATGGFLVADLTVTSTGGEFAEWVDSSSFVFVPAAGDAVAVAAPDVVPSSGSSATVAAGRSAPLRAIFDVAAGPGSLELRDAAGRTMVAWPIA